MRSSEAMRLFLAAFLIAALGGSARAQIAGPPRGTPPAEAGTWPFPPPDPKSWWDDKRPPPSEAADPLGGRRLGRGERLPVIDGAPDPATYRLWGLAPLQWQSPHGEELVLEAWVRPALGVRQSVVRVIVRRDGKAFVQARAGLACCEPGIARRVGFDAELPAGSAAAFAALKDNALWAAPRDVRVLEGGSAEGVCVDGVSYDLILLTSARSRVLRRACDPAAIGQVADVLEPVLRAALGHEPRFDVLFPSGADFGAARRDYQRLIREGGALKADPDARPPPPDDAQP